MDGVILVDFESVCQMLDACGFDRSDEGFESVSDAIATRIIDEKGALSFEEICFMQADVSKKPIGKMVKIMRQAFENAQRKLRKNEKFGHLTYAALDKQITLAQFIFTLADHMPQFISEEVADKIKLLRVMSEKPIAKFPYPQYKIEEQ